MLHLITALLLACEPPPFIALTPHSAYLLNGMYTVNTVSRSFMPERVPVGEIRFLKEGERKRHLILQFGRDLTLQDQKELYAAGVILHGWLGGNAYSATLPPPRNLPANVKPLLNRLRTIEEFRKEDKISPALLKDPVKPLPEGVLVQFFPDVPAGTVKNLLHSKQIDFIDKPRPDNTWLARVSPRMVYELAGWDEVRFIGPLPGPIRPL